VLRYDRFSVGILIAVSSVVQEAASKAREPMGRAALPHRNNCSVRDGRSWGAQRLELCDVP
jgi:hypothetical protein